MTLNPIQQNPFNTYGHISLKFASDPAVAWVCSESYRQGIYHEVSLTYIEVDHAVQMVMQLLFQQHTSEIFKDTKFVVVCCDMGPALLVSMLSTMVGGYTFIPMEATSQTKSELLHRARVLLGQNPLMILVDADFDDSLTERNTDTVRSGNPPAESSPRILNVKHVLAKISQAFIRTPSYKREDCSSPGVESCLSHGDNPCWIFYTSGSTGRPKPIAVSHREVCAYVGAAVSRYQVSAGTRWFVGTNATFDPSAGDALMTLSAGADVEREFCGGINLPVYITVLTFVANRWWLVELHSLNVHSHFDEIERRVLVIEDEHSLSVWYHRSMCCTWADTARHTFSLSAVEVLLIYAPRIHF
eukprot:m.1621039 g.1621039  ORF g.1621039 m.1621039 type:complete len:358 (-) comp25383_c0_seq66:7227-8300(-)